MSRKPILAAENPRLRLVSLPGGMWAVQRCNGGKGINADKTNRHFDPWYGSKPLTLAQAKLSMAKANGGKS